MSMEFKGGFGYDVDVDYCEIDGIMYKMQNKVKSIKGLSKKKIHSGEATILLPEQMLQDDEVIIDMGYESQVEINSLFNSKANSTIGERSVLVLRIIAPDVQTKRSESELRSSIFGERGTLKAQYAACSINQLIFNAFRGQTVSGATVENGIGEVTLTETISEKDFKTVEDLVTSAAKLKYGQLNQFDHVMLCFPFGTTFGGTSTDWIAYAYANHHLSVYNDDACSYLSVQMHEIAHNLNLEHAGRNGNAYADLSDYMGSVQEQFDVPSICFNGAKSWQWAWYSAGHFTVDPRFASINSALVGLVDYEKRKETPVLIRIVGHNDGNEYFLAFNRKASFNDGVTLGANKVIITYSLAGGGEQSWILAILNRGEQHRISRFGGGNDINIYVADIDLESDPPFASIVIGSLPCSSNKDCLSEDPCTSGKCNSESSTCDFEQTEKCQFCTYIKVFVKFDEKPEETRVQLQDFSTGDTIFYGPFNNISTAVENVTFFECLAIGNYKATIFDSQSDGICCQNGQGRYELFVINDAGQELLIKQGGEFLFSEEFFFSICREDSDCNDHNNCTQDRCDLVTSMCVFTPCLDCGLLISMTITTDIFPAETLWNIQDVDSNTVLMSGGPYSDDHSGRRSKPTRVQRTLFNKRRANIENLTSNTQSQTFSVTQCLGLSNYKLTVEDTYGDGMCCSDSRTGSYSLSMQGKTTLIAQGGQFGLRDVFSFSLCLEDLHCDDANVCTVDSCDLTTNLCRFEPKPCSECGELVTVTILTDTRPEETSWTIQSDSNKIYLMSELYVQANTTHTSSVCLPVGNYNFTIKDGFQNGMCCDSGNGSYLLAVTNSVIKSGGKFSVFEETFFSICFSNDQCNDSNFCTTDRCDLNTKLCVFTPKECSLCGAAFSLNFVTDFYPEDTSWKLENTDDQAIVLSGGPYTEFNVTITEEICLEKNNYIFTMLDAYGDGLLTNYVVNLSGNRINKLGSFSFFEETSFNVCLLDTDCTDGNDCTSNHCESSLCVFRDLVCSTCGANISVSLLTDDFPNETSWKIMSNPSGSSVMRSGKLDEGRTFFNISQCLQVGEYTFSLMDSGFDGFFRGGGYTLQSNGVVFAEGGSNFIPEISQNGVEESVDFVICFSDIDCNDNRSCTQDICDPESKICRYVEKPCGECGVNVTVEILTDAFSDETTWNVQDSETNIEYMSGGPYNESFFEIMDSSCLDIGSYIFIINDSFGDGLTQGNGEIANGRYNVSIGTKVAKQASAFGFQDQFPFTLCFSNKDCDDNNSCSSDICDGGYCRSEPLPCSECGGNISAIFSTFNFRFNATWEIENMDSNKVLFSGGPYLDPITQTSTSKCLEFGLYKLSLTKHGNTDTCCLVSSGTFQFKYNSEVIAQGGDTGPSEEFFFQIMASPSSSPSSFPSDSPSNSPSASPSNSPSASPSNSPSNAPSDSPLKRPSYAPSQYPSEIPTQAPSLRPTAIPSLSPSENPSISPSLHPSKSPSSSPSFDPSLTPSAMPSSSQPTAICKSSHIKKCETFCTENKKRTKCRKDCNFPVKKKCVKCPTKHDKKCDKYCPGNRNKKCKKECSFPSSNSCPIKCPTKHLQRCNSFCVGKKNNKNCRKNCSFPINKNCKSSKITY